MVVQDRIRLTDPLTERPFGAFPIWAAASGCAHWPPGTRWTSSTLDGLGTLFHSAPCTASLIPRQRAPGNQCACTLCTGRSPLDPCRPWTVGLWISRLGRSRNPGVVRRGLQPFADEEASEPVQGAYWKYVPKPANVRRSSAGGWRLLRAAPGSSRQQERPAPRKRDGPFEATGSRPGYTLRKTPMTLPITWASVVIIGSMVSFSGSRRKWSVSL